ncbi:MAG: LysR substrate-binding domain-containing protein [Saccharospirillum sp.]|jgi:LysR family glycine cleavage system transcriptional activator
MKPLPPLNALRCFAVAAEHLSFKKASESLFVTQAAVSHQIKALEGWLGVRLFERLNREVRLTPEGYSLLPFVHNAFETLESGVSQLRTDPNPDRLKVSVLPSFASAWLAPRLGSFRQRHSEYRVVLNPSTELERFATDTDIAIRFGYGDYPGLWTELLMHDTLIAVCVPDMLPQAPPTFDWLRDVDLVEDLDYEPNPWGRWLNQQGYNAEGFEVAMTIEDSRMLIDITLAGGFVGLARKSLVQAQLVEGKLVKAFPFELPMTASYYLVSPERYLKRPKVIAFRKWLIHELQTAFVPEMLDFHGS